MDSETDGRRWFATLLSYAPVSIRNVVVGAMLLLIVVVAGVIVVDFAAGDNPTTRRLETWLRMALMVLAVLVVALASGGSSVTYTDLTSTGTGVEPVEERFE
jgi:uncharacterized membrane protein YhdT